jgi:hypothetical protein
VLRAPSHTGYGLAGSTVGQQDCAQQLFLGSSLPSGMLG